MQAKVLIIGRDGTLLRTRGLLIEQAGYRFSTALDVASLTESASEDVALAILCHTLSPDEKRSAIQAVRDKSPRAMILHLRTLDSRDELPEHASSTVMDGPHELLTATHDLICRWENHLK
jgi:hypothetical protein